MPKRLEKLKKYAKPRKKRGKEEFFKVKKIN